MKSKMNRFVASVLAAVTIAGVLPTSAFAADTAKPGTLTEKYINEANGKEIAESKTSKQTTEIKTPMKINGYAYDSYSTVTEHVYAKEDITYIQGYPDKTVRGEGSLTRAETATMFYRLYDGFYPKPERQLTSRKFKDITKEDWYYTEVETLYNAGVMDGYEDETFRPNDPITRAEFAMVTALFNDLPKSNKAMFQDVTKDHWAYQLINAAAESGWVEGYRDGTFKPENDIKRSEAVRLVNKMRNRSITAEKLKELGIKNPYIDLVESYWAYADLLEATVKHSAKDWHELTYNDGKMNILIERYVDQNGKEIHTPAVSDAKENHAFREFEGHHYLGYITIITYVYSNGNGKMEITKSADKKTAKVGDTITYTVKASNGKKATADLKNVVMQDTIPSDLTFSNGSVQVDGKTAKYSYDNKTKQLSVELSNIAPGKTKTITFECTVNDTAYGKTIENTAILKADNEPEKPGTDEGVNIEDGKAHMSITKSADKKTAKVGDTITYTVKASNSKEATADLKNVVMQDTIPSDLTFSNGSVQVDGKTATYTYDNKTKQLSVELSNIAPGKTKTITFECTVNATAYGKTIENTAILKADDEPEKPGTDEGVNIEDGKAHMSVTKSVDKTTAKVGDTLIYTVKATNDKLAEVNLKNVVMEDALSEYVSFTHGSVQVDGYTAKYAYDNNTKTLSVALEDIAPGQTKTVTFAVVVNSTAYGKFFENTAILKADNETDKPGTDEGVTIEDGKADGKLVSKTVSTPTAKVGDTITYTIELSNSTSATADWASMTVVDAIPSGLTFTGNIAKNGSATTEYIYDAQTKTLTLQPSPIAPGTKATFTFDVTVDDGTQGMHIVNTAVLDDGGTKTNVPDTGVTIDAGKTLPSVTKKADVTEAKIGDTFWYTVTVKNGAKATAAWKHPRFTDVLPAEVELVGGVLLDGTSVLHSQSGNVISVPLDDLAPGESVELAFRVQLMSGTAGTKFQNVAVVEGENGKATGTDKGITIPKDADEEKPTDPGTEKHVTKTVDKTLVCVDTNAPNEDKVATFTIDVVNNSKTDWANVCIEDFINTQKVTFISDSVFIDGQKVASGQNWSFADSKFAATLGTIKVDESKVIQFSLMFKADNEPNSKYVNHVSVMSDEKTIMASAPEVTIIKNIPEHQSDIHYRLIHGSLDWQTGKLNWEPNRNMFLEEMAIMAYRLMTNDSKNIANSTGTTSVPSFIADQYRAEEAEAIAFFIRNNVLPAGVFNKTANPVVTNPLDNVDHIEGTQNHFAALMTFATGINSGLSGSSKMTRIEAARKVCALTGRDESPNTGSYVLAQFEDVAATEKTIVEVSNTHDYMVDSYGNETWISNPSMKD